MHNEALVTIGREMVKGGQNLRGWNILAGHMLGFCENLQVELRLIGKLKEKVFQGVGVNTQIKLCHSHLKAIVGR